ncbi:N-acetyltransferase [Salinivibrio kushneri]|uniref:N-acetyltransferase n=1 Tax=Salinivibrio kushneri TaxID=1908198 RepID=UPI000C8555EF|nr:N-acetyltransferase [Salinivibrio kushneri]
MENLLIQKFSEVNLDDPFFDTLKRDYSEFSEWFKRKADNRALVLYNDSGFIEGVLYCKYESGPGDDTTPRLPNTNHFKVGTFKFNPQQTRRGDRFIKKIFDYALLSKKHSFSDIYVTIFGNKHPYLFELFKKYGFKHYGIKKTENGTEDVLLRDLTKINGDIHMDYPYVNIRGNNKYLLAIYPEHHTRLFPDSILNNESPDIVRDISYSNSIHKIYICGMSDVTRFKHGDVLVMYRTGDRKGPAEYRAVATSLCMVESISHINDFRDENDFVDYCIKFSVFNEDELRGFYRESKYPYVINFTYNIAFPRRPNRKELADHAGLDRGERWGIMQLSEQQFDKIIELSQLDENLLT